MATVTTNIFQHADVEARMITGAKPRFEIAQAGEVKQTIPATRAWRAERKQAIEAAQTLAGVTPEAPAEAEAPVEDAPEAEPVAAA